LDQGFYKTSANRSSTLCFSFQKAASVCPKPVGKLAMEENLGKRGIVLKKSHCTGFLMAFAFTVFVPKHRGVDVLRIHESIVEAVCPMGN